MQRKYFYKSDLIPAGCLLLLSSQMMLSGTIIGFFFGLFISLPISCLAMGGMYLFRYVEITRHLAFIEGQKSLTVQNQGRVITK